MKVIAIASWTVIVLVGCREFGRPHRGDGIEGAPVGGATGGEEATGGEDSRGAEHPSMDADAEGASGSDASAGGVSSTGGAASSSGAASSTGGAGATGGDNEGGMDSGPASDGSGAAVGLGPDEPDPQTYCETTSAHPVIPVAPADDLAVARTSAGAPWVLFASQPSTQIVSITWTIETDWISWSCFDTVPRPRRMAAGNAVNGRLQVYATTEAGNLWVRQATISNYTAWKRVARPAAVNDVATLDAFHVLYAATDAGIFGRARAEDEMAFADAQWNYVARNLAIRVAAGILEDGRQLLVSISSEGGALQEFRQASPGTLFTFEEPTDISGDLSFLDVDLGRSVTGELQLLGVTTEYALMSRRRLSIGDWDDWSVVQTAPPLKSVAVGTVPGAMPSVFGLGLDGHALTSPDGGVTWSRP